MQGVSVCGVPGQASADVITIRSVYTGPIFS